MKATELIVQCLENEGVEYIFGVPGEENMDLLDALLGSSIRFVMTRHEQGAAFMADVYGRLTGKAGVCLATLGPGATNLITGVADANMDRAPVVALTGQADQDRMHKESHQHLDIVTLFRPVTKWNTSLPIPDIIPEAFRKAFKLAQSEKPGATHIEIPEDVARMETDGQPLLVQWLHPGGAAPEQIEKAARIISKAAHPIVLAGNGVIRGRASEALVRFAEKLNIPVATTFMAKGVIPDTHPLALGAIGLQTPDYVNGRVRGGRRRHRRRLRRRGIRAAFVESETRQENRACGHGSRRSGRGLHRQRRRRGRHRLVARCAGADGNAARRCAWLALPANAAR